MTAFLLQLGCLFERLNAAATAGLPCSAVGTHYAMGLTGHMVVTVMNRNSILAGMVAIVITAITANRRPVGADRWQFRAMRCKVIAAVYDLPVHNSEHAFNAANGILFNGEVIFAEYRKVGQLPGR